jgi:dual-specificity kinase
MSTPSTATATLPPHQPHYGYSYHQNYQANTIGSRANNPLLTGAARLGGSYAFPGTSSNSISNGVASANPSRPAQVNTTSISKPKNEIPTMPMAQSASEHASKKRLRSREPDWDNFYKNGLPKEVIVIDDSPPPVPRISESVEPIPARNHTSRTVAGGSVRHAAKKRKRGDVGTAYDPVYHLQETPSNGNTPHFNKDSGSGSTISTDRTTSAIHTTAATSLGSQYSANGGTNGYGIDDVQPGQKRKRVATRQQIAQEAKRRETEINGDAFSSYKPPPRPPIKASEVVVKVMQDVSASCMLGMGNG